MERIELLNKAIDENKEELFKLLGDLIRINTENYVIHGNDAQAAEYINKYFKALDIKAETYTPLEIEGYENHPEAYTNRALEVRKNCTATLEGNNHDRRLMLAAHIDTVLVGDKNKWKHDPICGEIIDGEIYGRGACDDKYGLAVSMFLMKYLKKLGIELSYDLLFTGCCDEEAGGSNGGLSAALKYPCDSYLNIDAMDGEIWNCSPGGGSLKFTVTSKKEGKQVSSVLKGLALVSDEIERFKERRSKELNANKMFVGTKIKNAATNFGSVQIGGDGESKPNSGVLMVAFYTTSARAVIDKELEDIKKAVSKEFEKLDLCPLEIIPPGRIFPYAESKGTEKLVEVLREASIKYGIPSDLADACYSDYPFFITYGNPCSLAVGLSKPFSQPGGAHCANESVSCDKLVAFTKMIGEYILKF